MQITFWIGRGKESSPTLVAAQTVCQGCDYRNKGVAGLGLCGFSGVVGKSEPTGKLPVSELPVTRPEAKNSYSGDA